VNTLTSPTDNGRVADRYMNDALVEGDIEAVHQLIARVLCRAHRRMEAVNAPNEARAVLHVAHSFADELATVDHRFDRVQFMKDAMEDPS
jgi:hypothetical protein